MIWCCGQFTASTKNMKKQLILKEKHATAGYTLNMHNRSESSKTMGMNDNGMKNIGLC